MAEIAHTAHVDTLIVGAGGAGAVLAARLSEDETRQVLVLEAGPAPRFREDFPPDMLDATRVPGAVDRAESSWWFAASLTPHRPYRVSRGRYLGGSTTTNGGYFQRPRRADFDAWSTYGGPAWSYDAMLPLLIAMESDLDLPTHPLHGSSGPIPVRRTTVDHPAAQALCEGAARLGLPEEPDKNGEQPAGYGPVPTNTHGGVRWNTALTYLLPAMTRMNLQVRGHARAHRVLVEHGRAIGVEVEHDGRLERIHADNIVLCAGAFLTPHLLMHSGIGPAAMLERFQIPVHAGLAGVGSQIADHPQIVLNQPGTRGIADLSGCWLGVGINGYLDDGADFEILQSLATMPRLRGETSPTDAAMPLLISTRSAAPPGRISLVSPDPTVLPHVEYDYLATPAARRRLREVVRLAAEIAGIGDLGDDADVDRRIATHLGTAAHACGGASFATGVTDPDGRVTGIEGLRVADTSLLPDVPSRGPAATAVLIGEYVAATMRV